MEKVFCMYRLKPGVSIEEYRKWSVRVDQKTVPFQPGVYRFEVYGIKGAEKGEPPFTIIEDIDVENWEAWQKVVASDELKEALETWNDYADASTLTVVYGEKIK